MSETGAEQKPQWLQHNKNRLSLSTQERERKRKAGGSSSSIRAISFHPCTEEDSATNGLGKNILQN